MIIVPSLAFLFSDAFLPSIVCFPFFSASSTSTKAKAEEAGTETETDADDDTERGEFPPRGVGETERSDDDDDDDDDEEEEATEGPKPETMVTMGLAFPLWVMEKCEEVRGEEEEAEEEEAAEEEER